MIRRDGSLVLQGYVTFKLASGSPQRIRTRIEFPPDYPGHEPLAFDAAGRFKHDANHHFYTSGRCCLWLDVESRWRPDDPDGAARSHCRADPYPDAAIRALDPCPSRPSSKSPIEGRLTVTVAFDCGSTDSTGCSGGIDGFTCSWPSCQRTVRMAIRKVRAPSNCQKACRLTCHRSGHAGTSSGNTAGLMS